MVFKGVIFTTAVLAIVLSSPAVAHNTKNPAAPVHHVDLADLLNVAGPFHIFLNYLQKTNVIKTFQSQANNTKVGITIFVPKDSAFAALKKTTLARLTKNQLKLLLLYHALSKFNSVSELSNLRRHNPVATLAGSRYTLNLTEVIGTIRVKSTWSNAKIGSSVYVTAPVAVYEVDRVLLPLQIFKSQPAVAPAPAVTPQKFSNLYFSGRASSGPSM
ncbi:Fasciclin-like arabinogalactan protein 7 [Dichanthelium oligosanthes]|uniref:Fasciclin-like arabinogalactan protein 7 n=1 Tax=Dichanthelium oligosanthes TaxID=888268 RepID=A0A1E5W992_9POAL|nr:Fasciclin-like arabinogalactan protein 7 [Dichanthelium oligosanthes]